MVADEPHEVGSIELNELSDILFRTRRLMELLVFKLAEEKLVATTDRSEWLVHAGREVDSVAAELQVVELERALAVQSIGESMGLGGAPRLVEIAAAAPAPWGRILADHRSALIGLLDDAHAVARTGRGVQPEVSFEVSLQAPGQAPGGGSQSAAVATRDGKLTGECTGRAEPGGTIDVIVDELRVMDAASGESGGRPEAGVAGHRARDLDAELAIAVEALQMHEVATAHAQPSPIRVIQASLVEFLR
ncbi:MAG: hypothetical protein M5T61_07350 [Acidimicrobiia bacterium]|nr:hypothetical protein [Acidimicrobiia bacterium]